MDNILDLVEIYDNNNKLEYSIYNFNNSFTIIKLPYIENKFNNINGLYISDIISKRFKIIYNPNYKVNEKDDGIEETIVEIINIGCSNNNFTNFCNINYNIINNSLNVDNNNNNIYRELIIELSWNFVSQCSNTINRYIPNINIDILQYYNKVNSVKQGIIHTIKLFNN